MAEQFQYVKLPDGSYGKFRADAPDSAIKSAIASDFPQAYKAPAPAAPPAAPSFMDRLKGVTDSALNLGDKYVAQPLHQANDFVDQVLNADVSGMNDPNTGMPVAVPQAAARFVKGVAGMPVQALAAELEPLKRLGQQPGVDAPWTDSLPPVGLRAAKALLYDPQAAEHQKAIDEPNFIAALGHELAAATPVVGPMMAGAAERIGQGDILGGSTEAILGALPFLHGAAEAPRAPDASIPTEAPVPWLSSERTPAERGNSVIDQQLSAIEYAKQQMAQAEAAKRAQVEGARPAVPAQDLAALERQSKAAGLKESLRPAPAIDANNPLPALAEQAGAQQPVPRVGEEHPALDAQAEAVAAENKAVSQTSNIASPSPNHEVIGIDAETNLPVLKRKGLEQNAPESPHGEQAAKPNPSEQGSTIVPEATQAQGGVLQGKGEMPSFTTGNKPGPNYSSEELAAFKKKNGIVDQPMQMVGEPALASRRSAEKSQFAVGQRVVVPGDGMADRSGRAAPEESGVIERFSPAGEGRSFNSVIVRTADGREIRLSYGADAEPPLRSADQPKPTTAPKAGAGELDSRIKAMEEELRTKPSEELRTRLNEAIRERRAAKDASAAETAAAREKTAAGRPKQALKFSDADYKNYWQVKEQDFIARRLEREVKNYERGIVEQQAKVDGLGPQASEAKRAQEEATLAFWKERLDRLRNSNPADAQRFRQEYIETVKKAISKGEAVPQEVIDQRPEFKVAEDARARYDKGRHTSFANRSAAIDDSLHNERGYKIKRQDGKPITPEQASEIEGDVADVQTVLGSGLREAMRGTDLTIAHTSGKHPFLSDAGGMYHMSDRVVSTGVRDVLGRPIKATGHELAHWLDHESGAIAGAEARVFHGKKSFSVTALSEAEHQKNRYAGFGSTPETLISKASKLINDQREVVEVLKTKNLAELAPEARADVERMKVHLGPYWKEPSEVFARLVEQYISRLLVRGSNAVESPSFYEKTPGWWTKESFDKLEPLVKAELDRRMELLREKHAKSLSEYGSQNTIVTTEDYQAAKKRFTDKATRMNAGLDPTALADLAEIGAYHLEAGARSFADWSAKMVSELGEEVKPHLDKLWKELDQARGARPAARVTEPPKPPSVKTATAVSGDAPQANRAGNINLDKLSTPEAVKAELQNVYRLNQDKIDAQRRGVVSDRSVREAANEMGLTPDDIKRWKAGKAGNAEQILAAREVMVGTAENIKSAQKQYMETRAPGDLLKLQEAVAEHVAVQTSVSGVTAEAGRALRQYRLIVEARRLAEQSNIDKALASLKDHLGDRWEEVSQEVAKKIAEIPEGDTVALNQFLRNQAKFTTADKVSAYWTANVLSGPRTHARNLISNHIFGAFQIPTRAVAGIIDAPLAKLFGRERAVYASETIPATVGYLAGVPDGLRRAAYIIEHGYDLSDATKLEVPRNYEFAGGAKNPFNQVGRLLVASDAMSKTMHLQAEINALAVRQALREGLKGDALKKRTAALASSPTPEMVEKSIEYSRWSTFNAKPDAISQRIIALREAAIPGTSVKPLRFIVPFINTPWNIVKIGFEYSPGNFLRLGDAKVRASGESSMIAARGLMGSMALAGAASLAANGMLTGAAPQDPAQRDAFYRSGKQPFSVKVGNRWVQYNQMAGPFALHLAAAAGFHDAFAQNGEVPVSTKINQALAVIGRSIIDASFFKGIGNVIDAVQDPERYAENLTSGVAGGFVPLSGAMRNVAEATDPYIRDAKSLYQKIVSGIPFASKSVPAKVDALGRDTRRAGGDGFLAFLASRIPEDKPLSAVDGELARLGVAVSKPDRIVSAGTKKYQLDSDQQRDLQKQSGQAIMQALERLFASPQYQQVDDERKQKAATAVIRAARERVSAQYAVKLRKGEIKAQPYERSLPSFLQGVR